MTDLKRETRPESERLFPVPIDIAHLKGEVVACKRQADSGRAFKTAVEQIGYILARDEEHPCIDTCLYILIDNTGADYTVRFLLEDLIKKENKALSAAAWEDIIAFMSDIDYKSLPTSVAAKKIKREVHQHGQPSDNVFIPTFIPGFETYTDSLVNIGVDTGSVKESTSHPESRAAHESFLQDTSFIDKAASRTEDTIFQHKPRTLTYNTEIQENTSALKPHPPVDVPIDKCNNINYMTNFSKAFQQAAAEVGLTPEELHEAAIAKHAIREAAQRPTATDQSNVCTLTAPQVTAVVKSSTLGRLQTRYQVRLDAIDLSVDKFTTKEQANAAVRLSGTYRDLRKLQNKFGLPPTEKDERVRKAERLREAFDREERKKNSGHMKQQRRPTGASHQLIAAKIIPQRF